MSSTQVPKTPKTKSGKHIKSKPSLLVTVLERTTALAHASRLKKRNHSIVLCTVLCTPTVVVGGDAAKPDENTMFDPAFVNSRETQDTLGLTPPNFSSFEPYVPSI